MRPRWVRCLCVALSLSAASWASTDDAALAWGHSGVYQALYEVAAHQWRQLYDLGLDDLAALSGPRYGQAKTQLRAAFAFEAGRNAFYLRRYPVAKQTFVLAARIARDTDHRPLAAQAGLWALACDLALKTPDAGARFAKAEAEAQSPDTLFLLAYLLDKLGVELEGKRKEIYYRAIKTAGKSKPVGSDARYRAWLAFRIEGESQAYLAGLSLGPDTPDTFHSDATGAPLSPRAGVSGPRLSPAKYAWLSPSMRKASHAR